jgi:glyoxylase-like metal-dependent hydrolase (beta-lactamase superfamily II)
MLQKAYKKYIMYSINFEVTTEMKIIQLATKTGTQMMGYAIVAKTGEVLFIDGGNVGDKEEVKRVIKSLGGHVNLWLITHPHSDHHDAVIEVLNDLDNITYGKRSPFKEGE